MPPTDDATDPLVDFLLEAPLVRDREGESLQRQLLQRIRSGILEGRLPSGCRLPGSRTLAAAIGVSRNSVTAAYDLLSAEGYIELSRQGTRVAAMARAKHGRHTSRSAPAPVIAARGASIRQNWQNGADTLAFRPGVPALGRFPLGVWKRCLDRAITSGGAGAMGYGVPQGEEALRAAILHHLAVARGVRAEPEQVVITEGAQEALALCVRLLTNPGDTAWVEDPGYRGAQTAFLCGDLNVIPVRVDADGLQASPDAWARETPRLIYTTPSHQYPTGAVLPAPRRLDLIDKARAHGAWIIEDDYDSEFRRSGELVGAMQGLVPHAPVLYIGTFSKTLFPALRIGFLVLPEALAPRAMPLLDELLRGGHRHEQLALAEFILSGQFGRHLGRMRRLYRSRRDLLQAALARHLDVPHTVAGGDSGMHLTVRLPAAFDDQRIARAVRQYDMAPAPLSRFALQPRPEDNGLVLGYGNTSESLFEPLVQRLAKVVRANGKESDQAAMPRSGRAI
ncbi:MocR-like pyridoxine biosynthesis transcription factor PdxR [Paraburkholderia ferrariae]|uniref:MocR-like pyridoxine biosynthesis transcription factor PdxR n=1 Tax=Paraburkholderia ferrariae TaxID=386056 RepID=UPI0005A764FD|nr:PLP-dependent aminotransferase family protein [Paraburkholderia ferrariae]